MTITKTYRSEDGLHWFRFAFIDEAGEVAVRCTGRPDLRGRDPNPRKTHLFRSGRICFQAGCAPRGQAEAELRAKQWAEYFLRYRSTGVSES